MVVVRRGVVACGVLLASVVIPGCGAGSGHASSAEIVRQVYAAYGGDQFQDVRYLRFDMLVSENGQGAGRFAHLWDRSTGDYRYETDAQVFASLPFLDDQAQAWQPIGLALPPGKLVALVNRRTGLGQVSIDGRPQDSELVRRVLQRIDHDTFWLLLPLELPAARTRGRPHEVELGQGEAVVSYRYQYPSDAGSTPDDLWAIYVDPHNHRIYRSIVRPQRTKGVISADWRGHQIIHGMTFSLKRVMGTKTILYQGLTMPRDVSVNLFRDPLARMN